MEKQGRRLIEMEQLNDKLEIEKNSHDRTIQTLKNQLETQVRTIKETLSIEKNA